MLLIQIYCQIQAQMEINLHNLYIDYKLGQPSSSQSSTIIINNNNNNDKHRNNNHDYNHHHHHYQFVNSFKQSRNQCKKLINCYGNGRDYAQSYREKYRECHSENKSDNGVSLELKTDNNRQNMNKSHKYTGSAHKIDHFHHNHIDNDKLVQPNPSKIKIKQLIGTSVQPTQKIQNIQIQTKTATTTMKNPISNIVKSNNAIEIEKMIQHQSKKYQKQHKQLSQLQQLQQQEEQTINPFRRTLHLFKHKSANKQKTKQIQRQSLEKTEHSRTLSMNYNNPNPNPRNTNFNQNQTLFSLSNFDSFKNYDEKLTITATETDQILQNHQIGYQHQQLQQLSLQESTIKYNNNNIYNCQYQNGNQQENQSSFIKIQTGQTSDQFSIIMDDFNCEARHSLFGDQEKLGRREGKQTNERKDRKWNLDFMQSEKNLSKERRVKTQYCQRQIQEEPQQDNSQFYINFSKKTENLNPCKIINKSFNDVSTQQIASFPRNPHPNFNPNSNHKPKPKTKTKTAKIFCLTSQQQQQSSQSLTSNVKQFYFDLRQQQSKLMENQAQSHTLQSKTIKQKTSGHKDQIKQIINNFLQEVEQIREEQIDGEFVDRLQSCLITVRKIPQLIIGNNLRHQHQHQHQHEYQEIKRDEGHRKQLKQHKLNDHQNRKNVKTNEHYYVGLSDKSIRQREAPFLLTKNKNFIKNKQNSIFTNVDTNSTRHSTNTNANINASGKIGNKNSAVDSQRKVYNISQLKRSRKKSKDKIKKNWVI